MNFAVVYRLQFMPRQRYDYIAGIVVFYWADVCSDEHTSAIRKAVSPNNPNSGISDGTAMHNRWLHVTFAMQVAGSSKQLPVKCKDLLRI